MLENNDLVGRRRNLFLINWLGRSLPTAGKPEPNGGECTQIIANKQQQ